MISEWVYDDLGKNLKVIRGACGCPFRLPFLKAAFNETAHMVFTTCVVGLVVLSNYRRDSHVDSMWKSPRQTKQLRNCSPLIAPLGPRPLDPNFTPKARSKLNWQIIKRKIEKYKINHVANHFVFKLRGLRGNPLWQWSTMIFGTRVSPYQIWWNIHAGAVC